MGVGAPVFYKYKTKFCDVEVSGARKLKALEEENAKLKKLLAETMLDNAILKDVVAKKMVTSDARRDAVVRVCKCMLWASVGRVPFYV